MKERPLVECSDGFPRTRIRLGKVLAALTPPNPTPPHPRGSGENPETKTFITWKHTNSNVEYILQGGSVFYIHLNPPRSSQDNDPHFTEEKMDFETEELGFDLRQQHGSRAHLAFSAFLCVHSQTVKKMPLWVIAEGHVCMSKRTRVCSGVSPPPRLAHDILIDRTAVY